MICSASSIAVFVSNNTLCSYRNCASNSLQTPHRCTQARSRTCRSDFSPQTSLLGKISGSEDIKEQSSSPVTLLPHRYVPKNGCSMHQHPCQCVPLTSASLSSVVHSFVAQWAGAGSGLHEFPGYVSRALTQSLAQCQPQA